MRLAFLVLTSSQADPYVTVKIDGDGRKDKKTYRTEICKRCEESIF